MKSTQKLFEEIGERIKWDLTIIKNTQRRISITGASWFNDGIWKIKIYDYFNRLEFEHEIKDSDRDLTFEDFIKESLELYNQKREQERNSPPNENSPGVEKPMSLET